MTPQPAAREGKKKRYRREVPIRNSPHYGTDIIWVDDQRVRTEDRRKVALRSPSGEEMRQDGISAATVKRAIDVHLRHAGQNVGPLGSDADIRFFALALAGEAGELANVVKKAWRDGKPLNREAALEELAGTACYLVGMAVALDCDLDAEMNKQMTAFEARPKAAQHPHKPREERK